MRLLLPTVSDIHIDLHNYLCNNLEDSAFVVVVVVDADVMHDVHINSHSSMVMDNAWDYSIHNCPMAMRVTVMCNDSNWRNFE